MLTAFKLPGALGLLSMVKSRVQEWVYAGFAFDFIFAAGSHWVVDGFGSMVLFPVFVLGLLVVSYVTYYKLQSANASNKEVAISREDKLAFQ